MDAVAAKAKAMPAAISPAVAQLKNLGVNSAQLATQFTTMGTTLERFENRLTSGMPITARAMTPVIQQQALLREELEHTFGSLAAVPDAARKAYDAYTERVERAKNITRDLTVEVAHQRTELQQSGEQWLGLEHAITKAAGAYGVIIAKAITFAAAFEAGMKIGERIAYTSETNKAAVEDLEHGFTHLGGEVQRTFDNALGSLMNLEDRLAHLDFSNAKTAFRDLAADVAEHFGLHGVADRLTTHDLNPNIRTPTSDLVFRVDDMTDDQAKFQERILAIRKEMAVTAAADEKTAKLIGLDYDYQIERLKMMTEIHDATAAGDSYEAKQLREILALEQSAYEAARKRLDVHKQYQVLKVIDPSIDAQTLADAQAKAHPILAVIDPNIATKTLEIAAQHAADKFSSSVVKSLSDGLERDLGDIFIDLGTRGGKNFGEMAGRAFNHLIAAGARDFAENITSWLVGGHAGDKSQKDALGNPQDPGLLYDNAGNLITGSTRMKVATGALGAAQIGLGAYQNTLQGGSRTAGTVGGALAGAGLGAEIAGAGAGPMGAVIGAVAGAIVGAIGAYVGAAQKRSEYMYGAPTFNLGQAGLGMTKNIEPAQQAQMVAQLQTTFNDAWNGFVRVMLKLPGSQMPGVGDFRGGSQSDPFQSNPSGHYMEHFQSYLSDTLPREIAATFKEGMEHAFVRSGLTNEAFERFWQEADSLIRRSGCSSGPTSPMVLSRSIALRRR
jgi:hypothetical protein